MSSLSATSSKLVTFRVGADLFAADVGLVERVLPFAPGTPIPDVPDWLTGVMAYEGHVIPMVDLRLRFALPPRLLGAPARVLVFSARDELVGAVVDTVLDVVSYDPSRLAPPPALCRGIAGEYLCGLLHRGEDVLVVLDVTRILSTTDRLAVARATHTVNPDARIER